MYVGEKDRASVFGSLSPGGRCPDGSLEILPPRPQECCLSCHTEGLLVLTVPPRCVLWSLIQKTRHVFDALCSALVAVAPDQKSNWGDFGVFEHVQP